MRSALSLQAGQPNKALMMRCCRRRCWGGRERQALRLCSLALLFICRACVAQESGDSEWCARNRARGRALTQRRSHAVPLAALQTEMREAATREAAPAPAGACVAPRLRTKR